MKPKYNEENLTGWIYDDQIYKFEENKINTTITYNSSYNTKKRMPTIKKIDKEHYIVLSTGEIKEYNRNPKMKDIKSVKRSLDTAYRIIQFNWDSNKRTRLLTLTYKENMTDTIKLQKDFEKFIRKLRSKYKNTKIEYIYFVEPQKRGSLHIHAILFFDKDRIPSLENTVSTIWTQGKFQIENIRDIVALGKYLCKNREKDKRLDMYPSNMKIYKKSAGIKTPPREYKTGKEIKQIIKDKKLVDARRYSKEVYNGFVVHTKIMRFVSK